MQPASPSVLEALRAREPIFHRAGLGQTPQEAEALMGAGYWEVGASGTRYDRAAILDVLRQRAAQPADDPWEVLDFACWQLAEKTYLATYLLHQGPRVTRRATVWQQTESGWKALYHQGTIVGG